MFAKHVKLLVFLVILPSITDRSNGQRQHLDANLRGNSFGLENFLFQSYEAVEPTRNVKPKRVRPTGNYRIPIVEQDSRLPTIEPEIFHPSLYESSRLKPTTVPISEFQKQKLVAPEPTRPRPNFAVIKEERTTQGVPELPQPETVTQEVVTERIRKRITMRRRRKRPPNAIQPEPTGDVNEIAIPKPALPAKIVVRTRLPDAPERLKPVAVKTITEDISNTEVTTEAEKQTTESPTTEKPSTINLKTFLKQQTETLSLSELLQTQNLSLADLLRGNKDASAILKARQALTSTTSIPTTRKTFTRADPTIAEERTTKKSEPPPEATTSRPAYSRFHPKIPRIKPGDFQKPETKPEVEFEETPKPVKRPSFDPQAKLNEMRMKLRNFQRRTGSPEATTVETKREETITPLPATTETHPYKKNRITFASTNNPELSVILPTKLKPEPETIKRPERLSNWTNRLPSITRLGQERIKPGDELDPKPLKVPVVKKEEVEEEPTTTPKTEVSTLENIRKPEAKDELIELLKSGHNAERLQKILQSRNMTIQELLDNREKPPLQVNISELFSNTQPPVKSSPQPTLFASLPDFVLEDTNGFKLIEASYDEPVAEESAPSIARVEVIPSREPKQFDISISDKTANVEMNLQPDDLKADTNALWKLSEKSIYYGSSYGYGDAVVTETQKPKIPEPQDTQLSDNDILLLETIRRSQDTNRKFKLDLTNFVKEEEIPETEDIEKSYIPPAVKSAIIASGVVMGIALFVFIAIFATCGWKQRQIRLKGSSSILGDTLTKSDKNKRANTLSPVSFKDTSSYKKTIDFDDETSESGTSNTSSYLWSTLKNTFTSRTSTLKSRFDKEEKLREDKLTLRRNESRRKVESRIDDRPEERFVVKKIDRDRNVINTSFNFKRSPSNNNLHHFNECVHGY